MKAIEIDLLKTKARDWKAGSAIKNTCYYHRGPDSGPQHPHGYQQPSAKAVREDPLPS